MNRHSYLSPLALCLLSLSVPGQAAEPVALQGASFQALQRDFQLMLPDSKKTANASSNALQFIRQRTDENRITHVRLQQQYAGFPVFRGYAIMHSTQPAKSLSAAKDGVKMNGMVYKGLDSELGKPSSSFVKNAADALQQFKAQYQPYDVTEEQITPMVYIGDDHRAVWAYKVSVFVEYEDRIPERPTAIIDATTRAPIMQWNDLKTIHTKVKGEGFGGNSRTKKLHFGGNVPYLEIERDNNTGICYMENGGAKVVDMQQGRRAINQTMKFNCKQDNNTHRHVYWTGYQADGYDLNNGAYSPSNDALYVGYVINKMYNKWYGLSPLTNGDKPMQLVMRVHYGQHYENAFWDGKQMTFGDGGSMMHPLVSLGIGAHEISHGFTEQHSDLVYYGQSGGMNEAFSDMAAQAAEHYSKRSSSWKIGAEIMKRDSGYKALRYMKKPSIDGASIDRADQYYNGLDVHYSSGVYNRLFYLLAHQPDWNTRKAFHVMLKANMDYWTPYSTFEQGGCGVISAASDLGFSVDVVKKSLDDVAISYQQCDESLEQTMG